MATTPNSAKALVNDPESPVTSIDEARKVQERVAIGARVVYEAVRLEGEDELERPGVALAWSGLAAGLSMGFSLLAEAALMSRLPDAAWRPLIARAGYSVGFLVVILGRQQLFTENTLTVILPLLLHKDRATVLKVLRLWSIVLSTNVVGTFLFALTIARIHFLEPAIQQSVLEVAQGHVGAGFWTVLARGVFAGWLIALMVWMLPDAASSRVLVILIITYLISISGSITLWQAPPTSSFWWFREGCQSTATSLPSSSRLCWGTFSVECHWSRPWPTAKWWAAKIRRWSGRKCCRKVRSMVGPQGFEPRTKGL